MAFLLGKLKKVAEGPESGESGAQVLSKPAPRRNTNRDVDDHKVAVTAAQVLKQVEAHQRKLGPEAKDAQRVLLQSPVTPGFGSSGGHSDDFTFADLARRGELAKQFQYSESHRFPLRATALDAAAKKRKIAKLKRASATAKDRARGAAGAVDNGSSVDLGSTWPGHGGSLSLSASQLSLSAAEKSRPRTVAFVGQPQPTPITPVGVVVDRHALGRVRPGGPYMAHHVKHGEWVERISGRGRSSAATARAVIAAAALTVEEVEQRQRMGTAGGRSKQAPRERLLEPRTSQRRIGGSAHRLTNTSEAPVTLSPGFIRNPRRNVATRHRFFAPELQGQFLRTAAPSTAPSGRRRSSTKRQPRRAVRRRASPPRRGGRPPPSPVHGAPGSPDGAGDVEAPAYTPLEEKVVLRPRHHPEYKPYHPHLADPRRATKGKRPPVAVPAPAALDLLEQSVTSVVGQLTCWDEERDLFHSTGKQGGAVAHTVRPSIDVWHDDDAVANADAGSDGEDDGEARRPSEYLGAIITPDLRRRQHERALKEQMHGEGTGNDGETPPAPPSGLSAGPSFPHGSIMASPMSGGGLEQGSAASMGTGLYQGSSMLKSVPSLDEAVPAPITSVSVEMKGELVASRSQVSAIQRESIAESAEGGDDDADAARVVSRSASRPAVVNRKSGNPHVRTPSPPPAYTTLGGSVGRRGLRSFGASLTDSAGSPAGSDHSTSPSRRRRERETNASEREGAGPPLPSPDGVVRGPALFRPADKKGQAKPAAFILQPSASMPPPVLHNANSGASSPMGASARASPIRKQRPPVPRGAGLETESSLDLMAEGVSLDGGARPRSVSPPRAGSPLGRRGGNGPGTGVGASGDGQTSPTAFRARRPATSPASSVRRTARTAETDVTDMFAATAATGVAAKAVENAARTLRLPLPSFMRRDGGSVLPDAVTPFAGMRQMQMHLRRQAQGPGMTSARSSMRRPATPAVFLPDTLIPERDHVYIQSPMAPDDPEVAAQAVYDDSKQTWRVRAWPSHRPATTREDVEQLREWHLKTEEHIAAFVNDEEAQQRDMARLRFITFFELFRQVVGYCPARGEAMHRIWLEHRAIMKRLCKDAKRQQRKLRRRERGLRHMRSRVMEGNVALMHKIALAKQKIEEMKEDYAHVQSQVAPEAAASALDSGPSSITELASLAQSSRALGGSTGEGDSASEASTDVDSRLNDFDDVLADLLSDGEEITWGDSDFRSGSDADASSSSGSDSDSDSDSGSDSGSGSDSDSGSSRSSGSSSSGGSSSGSSRASSKSSASSGGNTKSPGKPGASSSDEASVEYDSSDSDDSDESKPKRRWDPSSGDESSSDEEAPAPPPPDETEAQRAVREAEEARKKEERRKRKEEEAKAKEEERKAKDAKKLAAKRARATARAIKLSKSVEELEASIERAEAYHVMLEKAAAAKQAKGPAETAEAETQTYEEELETFFPGSGQPRE